ncbi:MAG TPA: DUF1428 domain-containing protein [Vicinamibacterales bacterium]|nr:DUF1428 domain-containing protein [Vicinamibacterales bacterium]
MAYVDGFLLPVPRRKLALYRKLARTAGKVWTELGAIEYRECVGDDVKGKGAGPMRKGVRLKPGEALLFSWIVYKNKRERDRVNKAVMKDPRILKVVDQSKGAFDMKRMGYGGFKVFVEY